MFFVSFVSFYMAASAIYSWDTLPDVVCCI